jgi:hypothetical protein
MCQNGATCPTRGLLIQWASNIKIQLSMFILYKADIIIITSGIYFFFLIERLLTIHTQQKRKKNKVLYKFGLIEKFTNWVPFEVKKFPWVSDCCLMPNEKFFSYIMARTSCIVHMIWFFISMVGMSTLECLKIKY